MCLNHVGVPITAKTWIKSAKNIAPFVYATDSIVAVVSLKGLAYQENGKLYFTENF